MAAMLGRMSGPGVGSYRRLSSGLDGRSKPD